MRGAWLRWGLVELPYYFEQGGRALWGLKQRKGSLIAWIKIPLAEGVSAEISQGYFSSFFSRISMPCSPQTPLCICRHVPGNIPEVLLSCIVS